MQAPLKCPQAILSVNWSGDGKFIVASGSEFLWVFHAESGEAVYKMAQRARQSINCCAFHPEVRGWVEPV